MIKCLTIEHGRATVRHQQQQGGYTMTNHVKNPPAFPQLESDQNCDGNVYHYTPKDGEGMSLRDYFIAHAPAEPHPWFSPIMPTEKPQGYKWVGDTYSDHHGKEYASASDAEKECGDNFYDALYDEKEVWQAEYNKRRYIQWPAAWADAMLEARAA
jgi:hypothetical protein